MLAVGVDVASRSDWSAVAVGERVEQPRDENGRAARPLVVVRHLDRFRGDYTAVLERLDRLFTRPALVGVPAVIDATGVGRAVVDLVRDRLMNVQAVTFTSGLDVSSSGREHKVPKSHLVSNVEVLLATRRLKVANGLPLADVLSQELADFGYEVSAAGHTSYNARGAAHDDLVAALSLAAWWLGRGNSGDAFLTAWRRRAASEGVPVARAESWRDRVPSRRWSAGPPEFRPRPDGPGAA